MLTKIARPTVRAIHSQVSVCEPTFALCVPLLRGDIEDTPRGDCRGAWRICALRGQFSYAKHARACAESDPLRGSLLMVSK